MVPTLRGRVQSPFVNAFLKYVFTRKDDRPAAEKLLDHHGGGKRSTERII